MKAWGNGSNGRLGNGSSTTSFTPVNVIVTSGMSDVIKIDAGSGHVIVLTDDNKVYTWGTNSNGQLGLGNTAHRDEPEESTQFSSGTQIDVAAGASFSMVLLDGGSTKVSGRNLDGQLGLCSPTTDQLTPISGPTISNAIDITFPPTMSHGWAVTSTGALYAWGYNFYGGVGNGTSGSGANVCSPTHINGSGTGVCSVVPSSDNHPQPCCVSVLEDTRTELGANGDQTFSGGFSYSGQDMSVNNTITLQNGNYFLTDCDVICWKDAQIVVESTAKLYIRTNSHLYACGDMWDGILVENGGRVFLYSGSIIEDAEVAFDVQESGYYYAVDATFNRNYIHIRHSAPTTAGNNPYRVMRSKFLCQESIVPFNTTHVNLLPPRDNEYTFSQIQVADVQQLLVGSSGNGNTFDHAVFGVTAGGTKKVEVLHNEFTDVAWYGTIASYGPGLGGETIDINYNSYERSLYPIWCYDNDTTVRAHITYNTIDFDGIAGPPDYMTGITVQEVTPASVVGTFNYWDISHDTIRNAPCGIHVRNMLGNRLSPAANLYVGDNTITHKKNGSNWQAAITSENVTEIAIANNTISHPTGAKHWWETGIRISGSSHNAVTCNYLSDHGRPILTFNDLRPSTDFVKNEMTDYEVGFHMKDSKIGHQVDATTGKPNDNQWISPWGYDYHIWCEGVGSNGNLSQFTVRNTGSTYYPTNRHFSDFGVVVPTPTTTGLTGPSECAFTGPAFKTDGSEAAAFSPLADEINIIEEAEGSLTEVEGATNWNARFNLFRALQRDSELLYDEEDALQAFATEQQQGNIGILHRAMAEVNGNDAVNAETMVALQSLEPTNRPEQTLKQVLQILLAQEEQISEEHEALLREMAQRCPIDDGFGVYIARTALLKIDTLPIPYSSDCERVSSTEQIAEKQKLEEEDGFQVYPNPTSGFLTLNYTLDEIDNGKLLIYTSKGALVQELNLNAESSTQTVDLENRATGLYIIRVEVNGAVKLSERISVLNP